MKKLNKLFDYLLLAFLVVILMLAASCTTDLPEDYILEPEEPEVVVKDYRVSSDILRHYSDILVNFRGLGYEVNCGFDTSNAIADFDLDGDYDIILAPMCSDEVDKLHSPIVFFENDGYDNFTRKDVEIKNNIGVLSGTTHTIVGDYNNDDKPDIMYVSHNGHGGGGGYPSVLISQGDGYEYIPMTDMERKWYAYASSADIDGDGDLDWLLTWDSYIRNDSQDGDFKYTPNLPLVDNMPDNHFFTMINFYDFNGDGKDDLIGSNAYYFKLIYNDNGSFDFNKGIDIPLPYVNDIPMQMNDRYFYDVNEDGLMDIITWSYPHDPEDGEFAFIQTISFDGSSFTDNSFQFFDDPIITIKNGLEWLRINDRDNDGNIEIYENQLIENWMSWEWNGEKFSKL